MAWDQNSNILEAFWAHQFVLKISILFTVSIFFQKKRIDSRINGPPDDASYRSTTTPYPHQRPVSPDLPGFPGLPNSTSMSRVGSSGALAYMLSGSNSGIPNTGACEIHMNSSYLPPGIGELQCPPYEIVIL